MCRECEVDERELTWWQREIIAAERSMSAARARAKANPQTKCLDESELSWWQREIIAAEEFMFEVRARTKDIPEMKNLDESELSWWQREIIANEATMASREERSNDRVAPKDEGRMRARTGPDPALPNLACPAITGVLCW